jgi:hypothetical protein
VTVAYIMYIVDMESVILDCYLLPKILRS